VIRSLGDMRTRVIEGREVMNYWDVEQPRFQLEQGPKWLTIDPATGQLSGKPDRAGLTEVVVNVKLERVQRSLDPAQLQWGVEKITDTGVETVGTAKQAFVIATKP
jgi:hypothetical protein